MRALLPFRRYTAGLLETTLRTLRAKCGVRHRGVEFVTVEQSRTHIVPYCTVSARWVPMWCVWRTHSSSQAVQAVQAFVFVASWRSGEWSARDRRGSCQRIQHRLPMPDPPPDPPPPDSSQHPSASQASTTSATTSACASRRDAVSSNLHPSLSASGVHILHLTSTCVPSDGKRICVL